MDDVLYVDIGFDSRLGMFVAQLPEREIAEAGTLEGVRGAVMRWAELQQVAASIRFRYSERAKLAMQ